MSHEEILADRLREAGYAAREVERAVGGVVAIAGLVTLQDGTRLFAKTLLDQEPDVFAVESAGLAELRDLGGAHGDDDWGAAAAVRAAIQPFRRR